MQNTHIIFPEKITSDAESSTPFFGRFTVQPLERGYGLTLGNALRRVLISSIPGCAIRAVKLNNVPHEFSTIKNVVEDVSEIILNLKQVRLKPRTKGSNKIEFKLKGPLEFIARHIQESTADYDILNQDLHIATLGKNAELNVTLKVGTGVGYVPSEENKDSEADLHLLAIDSIFTPVRNVKYDVQLTRVGQKIDYEKLILEITTDGTVTPSDALKQAAKILGDHLSMFADFDKVSEPKVDKTEESEFAKIRKMLLTPVDEVKLSVRAQNCLRSANITTLGDLVRHQEVEMLQFRNFGRKSLAELGEILHEHGLSFGMDVDKYLAEEKE